MSALSSIFTSLLGQFSKPQTQNKVYQESDLESIMTRGDKNKDGNLSLGELNTMINSTTRYTDVNYDLAQVLKVNFAAIADNAYKTGDTIPGTLPAKSDSIQLSELKTLAGIDGDNTNVTKDDFDGLQYGGNTVKWPTTTVSNDNNNQMQLLQILIALLFSGFGNNYNGGGYPPYQPYSPYQP